MAEAFDTWPHDATGIIEEALREFAGDGDGEDARILAEHNRAVRMAALNAAADDLASRDFLLPAGHAPLSVAVDYLRVLAGRIAAGEGGASCGARYCSTDGGTVGATHPAHWDRHGHPGEPCPPSGCYGGAQYGAGCEAP